MVAIEEIEQRLLALPLKHRVFLVEALLASMPPLDKEMTEAEEMAEVERREREIETGQVRALAESEFWAGVEADLKPLLFSPLLGSAPHAIAPCGAQNPLTGARCTR